MYLVGAAEQVVRPREDHNVRRPRAGRFPKPGQSGLHQTPRAPACSISGQRMDATAHHAQDFVRDAAGCARVDVDIRRVRSQTLNQTMDPRRGGVGQNDVTRPVVNWAG